MVKIEKSIRKTNVDAHLVMQLHDELIFEVGLDDVEQVKVMIKEGMENCMEFIIKMKIKIRVGSNWGNLDD